MADITESPQKAPAIGRDSGGQLTRREMLKGTTAGLTIAATGFFAGSRAMAEEASAELSNSPTTQLEALSDFAETSAALTVQIDAIDELMRNSGSKDLKARWQETRSAIISSLQASQETVIAELRRSYNRPGDESAHTASIADAAKLITPQAESLKLLVNDLRETEAPGALLADQTEQEEAPLPRQPRARIEIASPFESALADTGIYKELAESISKLAKNGLIPLLDTVQEGGGLNFRDLDNRSWRGRLKLKRNTRPQDVVPERIFEAVLEHASKEPAIRNIISRVDRSAGADDARWQKTRELVESTLDRAQQSLDAGVSGLLESDRRPRPGDIRQHMATIQAARADMRSAHLIIEAHARILEFPR